MKIVIYCGGEFWTWPKASMMQYILNRTLYVTPDFLLKYTIFMPRASLWLSICIKC